MKKSGNITIKLGPKEVENILTGKPGTFIGRHSIQYKVERAVTATFTDFAKDKAQEKLAFAICEKFRNSPEYEIAMEPFNKEKNKLWEKHHNKSIDLGNRQGDVFQQMLQKLFNAAGVIDFAATQWDYESLAHAKERAERTATRKKQVSHDTR